MVRMRVNSLVDPINVLMGKMIFKLFLLGYLPNCTPCYTLRIGSSTICVRPWYFGFYCGKDGGFDHCLTMGWITIWWE